MKKKPIIDIKRLEEVRQKLSDIFIKEKLSPLEVKIIIDIIYNNLENLEDIYAKAHLMQALTKNIKVESPPGVS